MTACWPADQSTSVRSLVFLSGRLVLLHWQAERRKRRESTVTCREGGKASTTQEDDSNCMVSFMWSCGVILWYLVPFCALP